MGIEGFGRALGAASVALGFLLLSGCYTYPYQSAFDLCDNEAGACYRYCEQFAGYPADYSACHADCEYDANRCFAGAYDRYAYSSAYDPIYDSWPWYGRYGRWGGPQYGYYFNFTYFDGYPRYSRGYPDYRYRDRPWRDRHGDRDGRRRGDGDRGGRRGGDGHDGADRPRRPHPDNGGSRPPRNNGGGDNVAPPPRATPPSPPPTASPPPAQPPRTTPPPQRRTAPPARTKTNRPSPRQDDIKTDPE